MLKRADNSRRLRERYGNKTKLIPYDGSQIQALEGLEPVRKASVMYIGKGYEGAHHLIKEIADNSIDEAIAGYATKVEVTLLKRWWCSSI